MVATEGRNDGGLVGKNDFVVWVGWEKTLEEGNSGVEDNSTLYTGLDADLDLTVVHKIGTDALNVGRRAAVEVG